VLATTDPEELLPTIVSRCQRFDFRRIGFAAMSDRLRNVASAEGLTIDDEAVQVIARHATGSLRDALGLLDQLAVYRESDPTDGRHVINADAVRAVLGVSRNDRVQTLVRALAERDAQLALETVNAGVEAGEDPRQLNRQLVAYLRVLLHERAGGSPDADDEAKALAKRFELIELASLAKRFSETDYRIRHSPYSQLPLEIALVESILKVSAQAPNETTAAPVTTRSATGQPSDAELLAKPPTTRLRDRLRGEPAGNSSQPRSAGRAVRESPPPAPEAPSAKADEPSSPPGPSVPSGSPSAAITVDQIADLWMQIRRDVKAMNRRIDALLSAADPVSVTGDLITLSSPYPFHQDKLNTDEVRLVIEDVISRLVGRPVRIICNPRDAALSSAADMASPPPVDSSPDEESLPDADVERAPASNGLEPPPEEHPEDQDEQRINAAKNIFDAEEITG
jgi:DNA polymerase-3 subunit gamma/tau